MGLSSFNRMRREKADVATIEAERFKRDNEARQARRQDRVDVHDENAERTEDVRAAEHAAADRIGKKVREGMKPGVNDVPLRKDHAAEIAGRNLDGVQTPKDPVDRVGERVPANTANEKLVGKMGAEAEGPTAAEVEAAAEEVGSPASVKSIDIPANWRGAPWQTRVALAKSLTGADEMTADEANEVIAAEEASRNG